MKLRIAILFFGLIIVSIGDVYGADWRLYDSNDLRQSYYNADSMTRPSKNIVKVWVRWNFTEKGVMDMVRSVGKKLEKLEYSISLNEINCAEKKSRSLSETSYDNKGKVIISSSSPKEWDFIIPESMHESLYKEVCK